MTTPETPKELKPLAYVTAIGEGHALFMPRSSLMTESMIPLVRLSDAIARITSAERERDEAMNLYGQVCEQSDAMATEFAEIKIERDELRTAWRVAQIDLGVADAKNGELTTLAAELRAKVAEPEQDAVRYNWLRSRVFAIRSARNGEEFCISPMKSVTGSLMKGSVAQHLDAAIDEARAAQAQKRT